MSDPKPIYLIARYHYGRDRDNYSTCREELQEHYGFFTRKELAQEILDQEEAKVQAELEAEYQRRLTTYRADLKRYEQRKLEIATLKAAGVKPTVSALPKPHEPRRPKQQDEDFYSTYEILEVELNGAEWE